MNRLSFEQLDKYRKIMIERTENALKSDHVIHGYMIYKCQHCGRVYVMNLEEGLEDPTYRAKTGNHKPVPFGITCIACGGDAFHVLWNVGSDTLGKNYRSWRDMVNEPNKIIFQNFFWNDPKSDCGVPIVFEPDYIDIIHAMEPDSEDPEESISSSRIEGSRRERRHPNQQEGYKRPRSNKKLYEY